MLRRSTLACGRLRPLAQRALSTAANPSDGEQRDGEQPQKLGMNDRH